MTPAAAQKANPSYYSLTLARPGVSSRDAGGRWTRKKGADRRPSCDSRLRTEAFLGPPAPGLVSRCWARWGHSAD